ncbi:MAG: hypothetical protein KIH00_00640 [Lachnospiraceae bacterium]|nr:hypothetical protein [Lachnospiraceae bacterium]MDY5869126.1 hypothetical protein [Lachnospiraceae bacterium]
MLGKLLKHEWKAHWKVPTLLLGVLMIIAVVAGLTFLMPIWDSEWIGLPLSAMMLVMLFYMAMIAASFGIVLYFAVRYYKSMFTDEGYLTHTLPVTARELLFGKIITMTAWNLIAGIVVLLSIAVFFGIVILALASKDSSFAFDFFDFLSEMKEVFASPYMEGFGGFCASMIAMALTGSVGGTMIIIGSVNLGQMVRKHRILGAIGAYFAIYSVIQIIVFAVMMPFIFKMAFQMEHTDMSEMSVFGVYTPIYVIMSVVYLIAAVGLYILSEYLIRRQLELE